MSQEAVTEEMVSVPISIFREGSDGQLDADSDRLAEAMMISLRGDVAAANARADMAEAAAERARERSIQLNSDMVAARARISGLERTKAELEARILAHGESEADALTMAHLGGLLVAEQDKCLSLESRLAAAEEVAAKSAERGVQLADLTARHRHTCDSLEELKKELHRVQLYLTIAQKSLGALEVSEEQLRNDLRRAHESLALADKAKVNAVAAAEQRVRDQLAGSPAAVPEGMVMISLEELAILRSQGVEINGLREHNRQISAELTALNAQVVEQSDAIEQGGRDLDHAALELELYAVTIKEQALLIKDQKRSLHYANMLIHTYHGRNNLPDYSRPEGHVTVFSLSTECLMDAGDDPIDLTKPLMWWTGRDGAGCMIALSEKRDERGRQVLITPVLHMEHEGKRINITDAVAPPLALRDEIADYIKSLDLPAIEAVLQKASDHANDEAYRVEPLLRTAVADIKRLQARRQAIKNSQAALKRDSEKALRLLSKKAIKAARQATQKGH